MTAPIHATTVAIGDRGVLIEGPSGSGKSDLALRLIDRGAMLVADDRTIVRRDGDRLIAWVPATIAGRIEVRGLGIVAVPYVEGVPIALAVTMGQPVPRLPGPAVRTIEGVAVPCILLDAHEASAPIKVERALAGRGLA